MGSRILTSTLSKTATEKVSISKAGTKARDQLVEAAGEVFAEKGLEGATSREICVRAGLNLAAVNYHFGGFEALYVATLKEAHRRVNLTAPMNLPGFTVLSAKDRLRAVLRDLVTRVSQPATRSWEMRLVTREMVMPTFAQAEFINTSIGPGRALLKSIIGELLRRPADDPLVARCMLTTIAPCIMLSIINRAALVTLLPDLESGDDGVETLADHVEQFVFAGLDALLPQDAAIGRPGVSRRKPSGQSSA